MASRKSLWRGYEYFSSNNVILHTETGEGQYDGKVKGSGVMVYSVHIDLNHPRKSKCSCPFAEGRRVICKHMIALYFTVFPKEAKGLIREEEECELEEEELQEDLENSLIECIERLSKRELRDALYNILLTGPEWIAEQFLIEYEEEGEEIYDGD